MAKGTGYSEGVGSTADTGGAGGAGGGQDRPPRAGEQKNQGNGDQHARPARAELPQAAGTVTGIGYDAVATAGAAFGLHADCHAEILPKTQIHLRTRYS